jgi:hypothetical protein
MPNVGKNNTKGDMLECVLNYTLLHARKMGVKLCNEHWYRLVGKLIEIDHEGKVNILRYQQVQSDRTKANNKVDIIIHINEEGSYLPIDTAISGERNMIKKGAKKKLQNSCKTVYPRNMVC